MVVRMRDITEGTNESVVTADAPFEAPVDVPEVVTTEVPAVMNVPL